MQLLARSSSTRSRSIKRCGISTNEKLAISAFDLLPERKSLASLRVPVQDCRGCDLWKSGTQAVFGEGKAGFFHARNKDGELFPSFPSFLILLAGSRYPFTFIVHNARTTCPLAGCPKARAGWKVVKMSALSIFKRIASES